MFIPTTNTGGREDPFSIPLGLEAKSLKIRDDPLLDFPGPMTNKQTNVLNPTSEVQNMENRVFQNSPFANEAYANRSFPNGDIGLRNLSANRKKMSQWPMPYAISGISSQIGKNSS